MIKRLAVFDMDGTLIDTPMPEQGKIMWEKHYGKPYPYLGWWGRPESLDLNVFDIVPFQSVKHQLDKEIATEDTFVIILTSRMEKLRPQVQAILDKNDISVDKLDMKRAEGDKGIKVLRYVQQFPELVEINVFEDRDTDIQSYENIRNQIPEGITFNIYLADKGNFSLIEAKIVNIINEEIKKLF
jgi:hypothetical protein